MNTGEPLLLSSSGSADSPSKHQAPARSSVGSLGCLCRTDSFSSSLYEDCDTASANLVDEGDAVPRHCLEECDVSRVAERFQSADSHFSEHLSVECSQKERRQKVSWGGVMEMQHSPSSLEIGVTSSSQEKPNRSQRVRHKSLQFEDPFSSEHDPRLIYINDPDRTNDRYEFTGNEIRTSNHTDVNSMQPSRVTDFGALASAGFRIEALANLNTNTLFDLKPNTHTIINDPLQFGNYGKSISPTDITTTAATTTVGPQALIQQKGAQPNLVALRTGNIENWGESTMADTSPRTDTSTDPDIDERNHMVLEV